MRFLSAIENTVLWFTDQDWAWWPFSIARPQQTEPFSRDLVVDLAVTAAVAVAFLAFVLALATIQIRGDLKTNEPIGVFLSLFFLAPALGVAVFILWGAFVFATAVCWNRRAATLSGTKLGVIPPKEPSPETDRLTFWLVVLSTVAYLETRCGGLFGIPSVSNAPDCGQGVGLFWMLLLFVVLGLTPIMRWSVRVVAQYWPPWSAAYKAAYVGLILCLDIVVIPFPEIESSRIGSMHAGGFALILMVVVATHSIAAALLRTPDSRRVGIVRGTTIAVLYFVYVGLGAGLLWAVTHVDAVQRFLTSMSA